MFAVRTPLEMRGFLVEILAAFGGDFVWREVGTVGGAGEGVFPFSKPPDCLPQAHVQLV